MHFIDQIISIVIMMTQLCGQGNIFYWQFVMTIFLLKIISYRLRDGRFNKKEKGLVQLDFQKYIIDVFIIIKHLFVVFHK